MELCIAEFSTAVVIYHVVIWRHKEYRKEDTDKLKTIYFLQEISS